MIDEGKGWIQHRTGSLINKTHSSKWRKPVWWSSSHTRPGMELIFLSYDFVIIIVIIIAIPVIIIVIMIISSSPAVGQDDQTIAKHWENHHCKHKHWKCLREDIQRLKIIMMIMMIMMKMMIIISTENACKRISSGWNQDANQTSGTDDGTLGILKIWNSP